MNISVTPNPSLVDPDDRSAYTNLMAPFIKSVIGGKLIAITDNN